MRLALVFATLAILLPAGGDAAAAARSAPGLTPEAVEAAVLSRRKAKGPDAALVRAQILLDRNRLSPGVIDGRGGENLDRAAAAFQKREGLPETGRLDAATFERLTAGASAVLMTYRIAKADVRGPFTETIPRRVEDQAKLKRLGYRSVVEMLAERFHMDEALLRRLNPGARFLEDEEITVAETTRPKAARVTRIEVVKGERRLRAFAADGALVGSYPASIGSDEKPAPTGSFTVKAIAKNPTWTYNPTFAFAGVESTKPFTVAAGPNNPVGAVWIDLSAETYGIHGAPEPSRIGKSFSNGCVRLTNWDALDLAELVEKGATVDFVD